MTLSPELADELARPPRWMYGWELDGQVAPIVHPTVASIHATRAAMLEAPVRAALAAAGPGARALDLACCEGWFSHRLLEWGAAEVVGVDIREQSIRRAELVREHLGVGADVLRFRCADVLDLDPDELGRFDVVLCLGLVYHVEHPMGILRLGRRLTDGLFAVESQTARIETPALLGFGARHAFESTDAAMAVHFEADQSDNPLASYGGVVSFCPNPQALSLMLRAAGFEDVERLVPGPGLDPDFFTGDRTVLTARVGSEAPGAV